MNVIYVLFSVLIIFFWKKEIKSEPIYFLFEEK